MSDNSKSLISSHLNLGIQPGARWHAALHILLDELEDSQNHPESKGMLWMAAGVAMFSG